MERRMTGQKQNGRAEKGKKILPPTDHMPNESEMIQKLTLFAAGKKTWRTFFNS